MRPTLRSLRERNIPVGQWPRHRLAAAPPTHYLLNLRMRPDSASGGHAPRSFAARVERVL